MLTSVLPGWTWMNFSYLHSYLASSNTEETHNTLKFAQRSKHVELKTSQNKIIDYKSLIKKCQKEVTCLKEELQQLRRGMMGNGYILPTDQEDLVNLKLQLQAGQVQTPFKVSTGRGRKSSIDGYNSEVNKTDTGINQKFNILKNFRKGQTPPTAFIL